MADANPPVLRNLLADTPVPVPPAGQVNPLGTGAAPDTSVSTVIQILGALFAGYHAYKRNEGDPAQVVYVGVWSVAGLAMPLVTGAYAVGQGYAQAAKGPRHALFDRISKRFERAKKK